MQPTNADDTNQPSVAVDNENWLFTKGSTPEITAISKPKSKPPNVATKVMATKNRVDLLCTDFEFCWFMKW
jgi:hypothetical protein